VRFFCSYAYFTNSLSCGAGSDRIRFFQAGSWYILYFVVAKYAKIVKINVIFLKISLKTGYRIFYEEIYSAFKEVFTLCEFLFKLEVILKCLEDPSFRSDSGPDTFLCELFVSDTKSSGSATLPSATPDD
jgi:hypothetical protein